MPGTAYQPRLGEWFVEQVFGLPRASEPDRYAILLCARDLEITRSHSVAWALGEVRRPPASPFYSDMVYQYLRQLVMMRFGVQEEERREFLREWTSVEKRRSLAVPSRIYVTGLAAEQQHLLDEEMREFVRGWFVRQGELRAQRLLAWFPRYLMLTGHESQGRAVATRLLDEREGGKSWAGDLGRTAGIAYALVCSGLVTAQELRPTLDFIERRLAHGFSGQATHEATVLKLLHRANALDPEVVSRIRSRMENEASVFLSYCHKDQEFVHGLARDLEQAGVRVWLDELEVRVGHSITELVAEGLSTMRYVAVVLSPHSVASPWVRREMGAALSDRIERGLDTLIPVLKESCEIPALLKDYRYADFRESYQSGLASMLRRLLPAR